MIRLLLGLGAATLAGLCLWLARRERMPSAILGDPEPWRESDEGIQPPDQELWRLFTGSGQTTPDTRKYEVWS